MERLCDLVDELAPQLGGESRQLITFVKDRPGHDRRYAIDATKLRTELGWQASHDFMSGLRETVRRCLAAVQKPTPPNLKIEWSVETGSGISKDVQPAGIAVIGA